MCCLEFCSHTIRLDKYHRIGLIAGMHSIVAYYLAARRVKSHIRWRMVWLVCRSCGTFTSERVKQPPPQRLAHIREFTVAHIPLNHISDRASGFRLDIHRRHRLQGVHVLQLFDGLPCGIIHTDGHPACADRIEVTV